MARVLVENLPRHTIEKDADELFSKAARPLSFQIKFPSREYAIAFIEYGSNKDAEAACEVLNGHKFPNSLVRAHAEVWYDSDVVNRPKAHEATQHRVHVSNISPSATSREIKEFLASEGDVLGVEVDRRGNAWACFPTHEEAKRVTRALHDSQFQGERVTIRMGNANTGPDVPAGSSTPKSSASSSTPRGSSSSRARSRSPTRPRRSRSRSRSRSLQRRSPSRHRSDRRSRSRSRSRSPYSRPSRRYPSRSRSRSRSR